MPASENVARTCQGREYDDALTMRSLGINNPDALPDRPESENIYNASSFDLCLRN